MSVLACDRSGCDNIMCDRCDGSYYICYECFEELVYLGPATDIEKFMDSPKRNHGASYAYFDKLFPSRED